MELFARQPNRPARIHTPPTLALPTVDTACTLPSQPYPSPTHELSVSTGMAATSANGMGPMPAAMHSGSVSPRTVTTPKAITFVLVKPFRARLPLRVQIYPHDTTDSIITTVKNFYGLYSGPGVSKGVSFEDEDGNTLIARYENFSHEMTVHVRVIEEPLGPEYYAALDGAQGYYQADSYLPHGPQHEHHASRPTSRASRLRSPSPNSGRGRRNTPAGTNHAGGKKGRSRSSKTRIQGNGDGHSDSFNGYSSGDGAASSFSSRARDQLGNTDISVENIVEGGRRKRAKFESSELPLFAPPQMPAATSNPSVSPARRTDPHRKSLPWTQSGQNPFSHPHPLQSPPAYSGGYTGLYTTPTSDNRRSRGSFGYPAGQGTNPGAQLMATPDPTVGSSAGMSEEDKDLAMQLMRLGEVSTHGRASASTVDDAFSGRADAASSTGATSDADSYSEDDAPAARRQRLDALGNHKKALDATESHFVGPKDNAEASSDEEDCSDGAEIGTMAAPPRKGSKLRANTPNGVKSRPQSSHKTKPSKVAKPKAKKAVSSTGPMTPASLPASRKQSIASTPAFPLTHNEEEQPDLSTKPRCQRCRKSKKGCDRQRPCGRCRDAGIPAELCISEDEGNGRKGRYGRHMGVPIKKEDAPRSVASSLPAVPPAVDAAAFLESAAEIFDKTKKRKRPTPSSRPIPHASTSAA